MTVKEKNQVKKLRESGVSYQQISKLTNIPISTIKTFCRRYEICMDDIDEKTLVGTCQCCGARIVSVPGRKKRKFCSDTCRMKWWNANSDVVDRRANYKIKCVYCGKTFISYGKKDRKYCSHECYIQDRYGREI